MKLKIKGSMPFFTVKKLTVVYFVSLAICVALRIHHVLSLIEPVTGFFAKNDFTVCAFYAVLIVSSAVMMIGSYLAQEVPDISAETVSGKPLPGIFFILLSFGFFLDFAYCFIMQEEASHAASFEATGSAFTSMMKTGSLPRRAEMIFAAAACVYFLVLSLMVLTKKYKGQFKIVSLVTVFWGVSRLITFFVKQISFIRVSDLILEIVATVFMTLFFYSLCECLSGVYRNTALWRITGLGLPASLCCLTIQIPRIVAAICDRIHESEPDYINKLSNDDYIINYVEIFVGLLAVVLLFTFMKTLTTQKEEK